MRSVICGLMLGLSLSGICRGSEVSEQMQTAARDGKYTFILFYRADDPATQRMAATIASHVEQHAHQATWVRVNVNQSQDVELVRRFDATRVPLPAVFGLAPNGAVTGRYALNVTPEQLENSILTPKYSELVKALQQQKIAVVCLQPAAESQVPAGIAQFQQDAAFRGHVHYVMASASDPAEQRFFERMHVKTTLATPTVLLFAPPGVHLGTFPSDVNAATLAATVHRSGKCNCEKCRHNR